MTHHVSDARAVRRNGQLIVAMLVMTAGAIMLGAAIATRYQFPYLGRRPQPVQPLSPFISGLSNLPGSKPVQQTSQVAHAKGPTGTNSGAAGSSTSGQPTSEPLSEEIFPAEEAGYPADKAYAVSGNTHKPVSPLW